LFQAVLEEEVLTHPNFTVRALKTQAQSTTHNCLCRNAPARPAGIYSCTTVKKCSATESPVIFVRRRVQELKTYEVQLLVVFEAVLSGVIASGGGGSFVEEQTVHERCLFRVFEQPWAL